LSELCKRNTSRNPNAVLNRNQALHDQFCDSERDLGLRRDLKKMVTTQPSSTFLEVREEAIKWVEEEERPAASRQVAQGYE